MQRRLSLLAGHKLTDLPDLLFRSSVSKTSHDCHPRSLSECFSSSHTRREMRWNFPVLHRELFNLNTISLRILKSKVPQTNGPYHCVQKYYTCRRDVQFRDLVECRHLKYRSGLLTFASSPMPSDMTSELRISEK